MVRRAVDRDCGVVSTPVGAGGDVPTPGEDHGLGICLEQHANARLAVSGEGPRQRVRARVAADRTWVGRADVAGIRRLGEGLRCRGELPAKEREVAGYRSHASARHVRVGGDSESVCCGAAGGDTRAGVCRRDSPVVGGQVVKGVLAVLRGVPLDRHLVVLIDGEARVLRAVGDRIALEVNSLLRAEVAVLPLAGVIRVADRAFVGALVEVASGARVSERRRGRAGSRAGRRHDVAGNEGVRQREAVREATVGVCDRVGVAVEAPRVADAVVHVDVDGLVGCPTGSRQSDGRPRRVVRLVAGDCRAAGR